MNAMKALFATALALASITTLAATPAANASILDTLDRLEARATSKESGIESFKASRRTPEFLQQLRERATSRKGSL